MSYTLGFLLCDHVPGPLAERFEDYPAMFPNAFAEVSEPVDWRVYEVTEGELPADPDACDGYLISGSRHGAYDPLPWIPALEDFVRRLAQAGAPPLVGLCFGHQVIGRALGAAVAQAPQGWGLGIRPHRLLDAEDWMEETPSPFKVPVCHQDQVLTLPPGARLLASSDHCPNFVVEFAPGVLGIQGHPEFSSAFIAALVEWRRGAIPDEVHASAEATLGERHDNRAIKLWIARYLGMPVLAPHEAPA